MQYVPMAVEMVLVKEAGYGLRDLRGTSYTWTERREPTAWEQHLGALTPGVAWKTAGAILALSLILAYQAGAASGVVVSAILAVALHYLGQFNPEGTEVVHEVDEPGMAVEEVMGRLHQHDEHEQMKKEEQEAQARKAKRQGRSP